MACVRRLCNSKAEENASPTVAASDFVVYMATVGPQMLPACVATADMAY